MPNLLAIDTASANCTVALLMAGKLTSSTLTTGGHTAQQALPLLAEVLAQAGAELRQVEVIAVLAGPGSFTGIRVGIGIAQGLGMANSIPVLPVSTLALKAFSAMRAMGASRVLVSDVARGGEIYFGAFRYSPQSGVELLGAEQVGTPADIILDSASNPPGEAWVAAGSGWKDLAEVLQRIGVRIVLPAIDHEFSSGDLCELAKLRFIKGDALPAELALPNYVKDTFNYARQ